jgi:hypothetical protein
MLKDSAWKTILQRLFSTYSEVYIVRNLQTVENLNVRIQCLIIVLSTTLAIPN